MILLELAVQGVRGVAPAGGRSTLRPGYNVISADGAALRRLVEALLWPDPRDADAVPRASPGPGGAPVRAGVTLLGSDNVTYRLVRDLAAGCQLQRFDPERRSFSLVSRDLAAVAQYLIEPGGAPPRSRFAAMLSIAAADLPSRRAGTAVQGAFPAPAPRGALAPAETQRKLAELRRELERSRVADKLQYQMDGHQTRLFKLEEVLRSGAKVREGLEAAEAALRELEPVARTAGSLGDPDARIAAYEKATARRDEALAKLDGERSELGEEKGPPPPFWRDPQFLIAAGAGLACAGAGGVGAGMGDMSLRYLALLDMPAFGYAGFVAWRWVGAQEALELAGRRRRRVLERERKVQEQYERDTGPVRAALKALGVAGLGDLKDALGRLADARSAVAEARRKLEDWEAKAETRDAAAERARVESEIRDVEVRLQSEAGGYVRDARSIEMEISRIEAEMGSPAPAAVAAPPAAPAGDPLKALLGSAAAELQATPAAALRAVSQRVVQVLPALSAQRLASCIVDDRGNLLVQSAGRTSPVATLPPPDRDLCFLALKLAFLEHALARGKAVAVVDDAFAGLPDVARRVAARLLKQLARSGQVLHATADPAFREAADHAA